MAARATLIAPQICTAPYPTSRAGHVELQAWTFTPSNTGSPHAVRPLLFKLGPAGDDDAGGQYRTLHIRWGYTSAQGLPSVSRTIDVCAALSAWTRLGRDRVAVVCDADGWTHTSVVVGCFLHYAGLAPSSADGFAAYARARREGLGDAALMGGAGGGCCVGFRRRGDRALRSVPKRIGAFFEAFDKAVRQGYHCDAVLHGTAEIVGSVRSLAGARAEQCMSHLVNMGFLGPIAQRAVSARFAGWRVVLSGACDVCEGGKVQHRRFGTLRSDGSLLMHRAKDAQFDGNGDVAFAESVAVNATTIAVSRPPATGKRRYVKVATKLGGGVQARLHFRPVNPNMCDAWVRHILELAASM